MITLERAHLVAAFVSLGLGIARLIQLRRRRRPLRVTLRADDQASGPLAAAAARIERSVADRDIESLGGMGR